MKTRRRPPIYRRVREIIESARAGAARSVNTTQVVAYWLIGREIVEEEQKGRAKAGYGDNLMRRLASELANEFGNGYGLTNLKMVRKFYLIYGQLVVLPIGHSPRGLSAKAHGVMAARKGHALSGHSNATRRETIAVVLPEIGYAARSQSWTPGLLNPNLSWTHYRTLLRVDKAEARSFYEIEAVNNSWSARELERQINSSLYERLAMSRDREGLMRLARMGHEVQHPADVFKDPMVMEFLGLPESPKLVETELEQALIDNLQTFLLELGRGFAFVARQERLTLDGDHFYIDLVFYHAVLKCYVIIDLKTGKLTHQDLGQLQLYVNYYDRERRTKGDNPTLGLILCADKNDAVVRYTLGPDQQRKIFASRYKLHLPSEAELRAEMRREVKALAAPKKHAAAP